MANSQVHWSIQKQEMWSARDCFLALEDIIRSVAKPD